MAQALSGSPLILPGPTVPRPPQAGRHGLLTRLPNSRSFPPSWLTSSLHVISKMFNERILRELGVKRARDFPAAFEDCCGICRGGERPPRASDAWNTQQTTGCQGPAPSRHSPSAAALALRGSNPSTHLQSRASPGRVGTRTPRPSELSFLQATGGSGCTEQGMGQTTLSTYFLIVSRLGNFANHCPPRLISGMEGRGHH